MDALMMAATQPADIKRLPVAFVIGVHRQRPANFGGPTLNLVLLESRVAGPVTPNVQRMSDLPRRYRGALSRHVPALAAFLGAKEGARRADELAIALPATRRFPLPPAFQGRYAGGSAFFPGRTDRCHGISSRSACRWQSIHATTWRGSFAVRQSERYQAFPHRRVSKPSFDPRQA